MRLISYKYLPDGRVQVEEKKLPFSSETDCAQTAGKSRIEIFNIHGDLICIIPGKESLKLLKLQKGFYLLREVDHTGRIINRSKLAF